MSYTAGNLELNVLGISDSAVTSIRNTAKALNSLYNSIKKINGINLFNTATNLNNIFSNLARNINKIDTSSLEKLANISSSVKAFTGIAKLEKIDYDKVTVGFGRLTTAITPFIEKVQGAEKSLTSLYGILSKASGKKIRGILDTSTTPKKGGAFSFLNIARWGAIIYSARRLARVVSTIVQGGADYTESLNLWETSMGDNIEVATEFVNKMNEAYGISEKTLMNAQAIFKNMLGSLGQISDQMAYALSEGITQMALDYASLYNVGFEEAFTKFQAALAGQVRPIRSVSGYDITETTLFQLYQSLDGTKTMRQLTRTEKQLLSIYAVFQQMDKSGAIGDLNKTMNSFANQGRVWAESLGEVKTWLGVIITYTIQESGIMVKFNALLITASRYLEAVARNIGAIQSFGGSDPFAGAEESAENALDAIDELNGKLLDFDKFRSLSGSQENVLGIDEKLITALQGYDSIISNASLEARKLSDEWLTALGFTIDTNGELVLTNEQLEKAKQKIQSIINFLGGFDGKTLLQEIIPLLSSLGAIFVSILPTITAISKVTAPIIVDIVQTVGAIVELLDNLGLLQVVILGLIGLKIFNKINNLTKGLTALTSRTKLLGMSILSAMTSFMLFDGILSGLQGTAKTTVSWIVTITSALATMLGVVLAIRGGVQGGLIGATIAGLGVGGLLAGIKGISSSTIEKGVSLPDTKTVYNSSNSIIAPNMDYVQTNTANPMSATNLKNAVYQALLEYGNSHSGGNEPIVIKIGEEEVFRATRKSAKRQGLDFVKV